MKILFVNTLYPPEIIGGAEVSVSLLAEALAARGHDVVAVTLHKEKDAAVSMLNGVHVYRLPLDNIYWPYGNKVQRSALQRLRWHLHDTWNRKAARRFGEILDIEKPDVIHSNNLTGFSISLWYEARRRKIRIVHTLRDYSLICKRATLFKDGNTCGTRCGACATMTLPYRYSSHLVNAVASNSQFVLGQHHKFGFFPGVSDRVIYNIADFANVAPPQQSTGTDLVFGFIGRVEAEKGIDVILKATELLPATGWRLKIAGKGLEDYEKGLRHAHANDRIEWMGFAKSRDFYASIDVCLISSVWPEPLPRTLIESIAAGRATICSTAGGIPEISAMSALIGTYEPHDYRALAALMTAAINDTSRWKQAQPPQSDFLEKFSPDSIANQYLQLYSASRSNLK